MSMTRHPAIRPVVLAIVPLLLVTACLCPAIDFGPQRGGPEGLHGVTSGWLAFVFGGVMLIIVAPSPEFSWVQKLVFVTWLANPLLVLGWILLACKKFRGAVAAGLLALLLGAWYLAFPIGQPLVGAYFWAASSGVLAVGALAARLVRERLTTELGEPDAEPLLWPPNLNQNENL